MTLRGLMRHLARLDLDARGGGGAGGAGRGDRGGGARVGADGGEVRAAGTGAMVGWRSAALRRRERGDVGVPPAPVLAPVAVAHGARAAAAVGAAVADALRGA